MTHERCNLKSIPIHKYRRPSIPITDTLLEIHPVVRISPPLDRKIAARKGIKISLIYLINAEGPRV